MPWTEAKRVQGIHLSLLRRIMGLAGPDAVNMALGELGYDMPLELREYASRLILTETPRYTANAGIPELKAAISAYHGSHYPAEGVCVTNGAEEALYAAMMAYLNPGDKIAIVEPYYPAYATIAGVCEAEVVNLPYEDDLVTIDWDKWDALLSNNVKLILFSNPSNPLGTFFDDDTVHNIIHLAAKHNVLVIADEIYHDLYLDKEPLTFSGLTDNLILISGVSKSLCMSGWRMGWAIGQPQLTHPIIRAHQYISTCAGWLAQKVTLHALSDTQQNMMSAIRNQLKGSYDYTMGFMQEHLPHLHFLRPTSTPYMMLKLECDDLHYCQNAAEKGVIVVPGRAFGNLPAGWVRINFALQQPLLQKGLEQLSHVLQGYTV